MERNLRSVVRWAVGGGGGLLAALLIAGPALAHPLGGRTTEPVPGPCALTRAPGEAIQDFSTQLIQCAATRWPVPGGSDKAICIAQRESGLIPTAASPTGEYVGLFQHLAAAWPDRYAEWTRPVWQLKPSPLNGRTNAIVTMRMVNAAGWGPWSGVGC
ncbi:MAG: hypothetical protein ACXVPX_03755 [Actinomycetota bacterium]